MPTLWIEVTCRSIGLLGWRDKVSKHKVWRSWSNVHPWLMRHGVCLAELDGSQREHALALSREAMSVTGYRTARDIMRLNEHVLEITGKAEESAII